MVHSRGHTPESFSEPLFQAHLLGGIQFAAGVKPAGLDRRLMRTTKR